MTSAAAILYYFCGQFDLWSDWLDPTEFNYSKKSVRVRKPLIHNQVDYNDMKHKYNEKTTIRLERWPTALVSLSGLSPLALALLGDLAGLLAGGVALVLYRVTAHHLVLRIARAPRSLLVTAGCKQGTASTLEAMQSITYSRTSLIRSLVAKTETEKSVKESPIRSTASFH